MKHYSESDCTTILFLLRGGLTGEFSSPAFVTVLASLVTLSSPLLLFRLVAALNGVVVGVFFTDNGVLTPFFNCVCVLGVAAMLLAGRLEPILLTGRLDTGELSLLDKGELNGLLLLDLDDDLTDFERDLADDNDLDLDLLEDANLESSIRESCSRESSNLESSILESKDCDKRLLSSLDLPPGLGDLLTTGLLDSWVVATGLLDSF